MDFLWGLKEAVASQAIEFLPAGRVRIGTKEYDASAPTAWTRAQKDEQYNIATLAFYALRGFGNKPSEYRKAFEDAKRDADTFGGHVNLIDFRDRSSVDAFLSGKEERLPASVKLDHVEQPGAKKRAVGEKRMGIKVVPGSEVQTLSDAERRHRTVRTRDNILLVDGPVCESVSQVLRALNERLYHQSEQIKRSIAAAAPASKSAAATGNVLKGELPVSRTEQRFDTKRVDIEREHAPQGGDLMEGIDTLGSALPGMSSKIAKARESGRALEEEMARARREKKRRAAEQALRASRPGVMSAAALAAAGRASVGRDFTPIIMVPAGLGAIINARNAGSFLGEQRYVPVNSADAPIQKTFTRKRKRGAEVETIEYQIEHDPKQLSEQDWNRVVAVVVLGKNWQFKNWPAPNNVVDILSRVLGVHIRFDDGAVDANVQKWNVKQLTISREKRHLDPVAVRKFWGYFDEAYNRKRASMS